MFDRRSFLKGASSASAVSFAGATSLLAALGNSKAYAADVSGYKAIVCLFFFGGQDAHDTVLPYDQASYDRYAELRPGLLGDYAAQEGGSSRDRDRLLPLNPTNSAQFGSRQFALPEALGPLKNLFDNGNAAVIGNVGPLVEPANADEFENQTKEFPRRLFSHNDQQSTWLSAAPEGEIFGWGGKIADTVNASNANQNEIFSAISTFGNTVFLAGNEARPYNLSVNGPPEVNGLRNFNSGLLGTVASDPTAVQILEDHYKSIGAERANLFERDVAAINSRAFISNEQFSAALDSATPIATPFPQSSVGTQLQAVANAINVRDTLGMARQVFFVAMGGFDTHDNQADDLTGLHAQYAAAINSFYSATVEMGLQNDVTLFTAADFGRALLENGNGTDHG
ncbi:MAG: DUF1501 domain-containing protein, partial [Hyphomonadaceae bacterium]|nr:DUF1501 domain-containing protein [Hyphomonadaceae bacterium]